MYGIEIRKVGWFTDYEIELNYVLRVQKQILLEGLPGLPEGYARHRVHTRRPCVAHAPTCVIKRGMRPRQEFRRETANICSDLHS